MINLAVVWIGTWSWLSLFLTHVSQDYNPQSLLTGKSPLTHWRKRSCMRICFKHWLLTIRPISLLRRTLHSVKKQDTITRASTVQWISREIRSNSKNVIRSNPVSQRSKSLNEVYVNSCLNAAHGMIRKIMDHLFKSWLVRSNLKCLESMEAVYQRGNDWRLASGTVLDPGVILDLSCMSVYGTNSLPCG